MCVYYWIESWETEKTPRRLYHVISCSNQLFSRENSKMYFLIYIWEREIIIPNHDPTACHTNQVISPLDKLSDDLLTLRKVQLNLSLYPSINSHKKIKLSMYCKITNYLLKVNKLTTFTCNILVNKTDIQNVYAFSLIIVFHDEILIKRDWTLHGIHFDVK